TARGGVGRLHRSRRHALLLVRRGRLLPCAVPRAEPPHTRGPPAATRPAFGRGVPKAPAWRCRRENRGERPATAGYGSQPFTHYWRVPQRSVLPRFPTVRPLAGRSPSAFDS